MARKLNGERFTRREVDGILESLEDPAILIGRDYVIRAVNSKYAAEYSTTPEKLEGRHCYEVSHRYSRPCDEMGEDCPIRRCVETGQPRRSVHVHQTPGGPSHCEISTLPVAGESGEVRWFVESIRPFLGASAQPGQSRLVGRSPAFNHVLSLVRRVAKRSTPVLLLGETGTGKELLASAIHELSPRSRKPFVPVDCSGLSETLFESELFGHERGAFTGAVQRRVGLVESVAGGTLFLDEVGDIPLSQQVKLLRLVENETFRRVGNTRLQKADFRLVCATHRDLPKMVEEGTFRRDLYYRLGVFPIRIPPLRERAGDLELLARTLLRQVGCKPSKELDPRSLEMLEGYAFGGNVRELRNLIERACMLADGDVILPEHFPEACSSSEDGVSILNSGRILPLEEVERRYLAWAVERFEGDNRELARRLGLSERTLYRKLQRVRSDEEDVNRNR